MKRNTKGFTLVEIMIVVAIIGLLIAIALPNFMKARKKSVFTSAKASMSQIEANVETAKLDGQTITWTAEGLEATLTPDYLKTWPVCPGGGVWVFTDDGTNSTVEATIDGNTFGTSMTLTEYLAL